jgi:hypothetical protein
MKRRFVGKLRTALVALCALSFMVEFALADPVVVRVVGINGNGWSSRALLTSETADTEVIASNCVIGPPPTYQLGFKHEVAIEDFLLSQCGVSGSTALARFTVTRGTATIVTEATYRDSRGNVNTVSIPALETFLPPVESTPPVTRGASLNFDRLEKHDTRSTFFAFFNDESFPVFVNLTIYEGDGTSRPFEELALPPGFTFYELRADLKLGRVVVNEGCAGGLGFVGCDKRGVIYALALVGDSLNGAPRVELPVLSLSVSLP